MATPNEEARELLRNFRAQDSRQQIKRLTSSIQSKEKLIERFGEEVPEEEGPGFFSRFFDVIDAPARPVRGVVQAALSGDSEFLDQGKTFGEFLRDTDALGAGQTLRDIFGLERDSMAARISRGVSGFIGDVVTDPLTYLTLGTSTLPRIGGVAITDAATKVAKGSIGKTMFKSGKATAKELTEALTDDLAENIFKKSAKRFGEELTEEAQESLMLTAKLAAGDEVAQRFARANTLFKDYGKLQKQGKAIKALEEAGVKVGAIEDANSKLIQAVKDLQIVDNATRLDEKEAYSLLEPLFAKPAFRIRSLLAPNTKPSGFRMPLLNSPTGNVPVITDASEKALEFLNGKMFGAKLKVGNKFRESIATMKEQGGALETFADILQGAAKLPGQLASLVSQRVALGGHRAKEALNEHQIARAAVDAEAIYESGLVFDKLGIEGAGDLGNLYSKFLDQKAIQRGGGLEAVKSLELSPDDWNEFTNLVQTSMKDKAPAALESLNQMRKVYDDLAREAVENGLVSPEDLFKEYIPLVVKQNRTKDAIKLEQFVDRAGLELKGPVRQPFTFERALSTLEEAKRAGFEVETNLQVLLAQRLKQQKLAIADKKFMELMSYEFGMTPSAYAQLRRLASDENEKVREAANAIAQSRGFDLTTSPSSVDLHKIGLLKTSQGNIVDEATYEALKRGVELGDKDSRQEALRLGLDFITPDGKTKEQIRQSAEAFNILKDKAVVLGRRAEDMTTRSAANTVDADFIKKFSPHFSPEEKRFFSGVLPRGLVSGINDSLRTRSLIGEAIKSIRRSGQDQLADALEYTWKGYIGLVRMLKVGAIALWPSYYFRNATGAQFQQLQAVSALGEALAPLKWNEHIGVLKRGKDLVTNSGKIIPHKQIMKELAAIGPTPSLSELLDLNYAYGDMLHGAMRAKAPSDAKAAGTPLKLLSKSFNKAKDGLNWFSQKVESAGRFNLYLSLRQRGFDPVSARQTMLNTMVDYTRGKTPFERDVLNNLFFFYSFARRETSNTLKAMFTNPGKITTQLHAIDAVKEMLMQDGAFEVGEPIEEFVATNRQDAMFSKIVGRTETGLPEVLQGIGLPLEETFQFFNPVAPKELNLSGIMQATKDTIVKQTHTAIASLNPALKAPIELFANKNFFFDRPLDDRSLRKIRLMSNDFEPLLAQPYDKIPKAVVDGINAITKTFLQIKPNGDGTYTADPNLFLVFNTIVPGVSRALATANALGNTDISAEKRALRFLTGVRTFEVDVEKSKAFDRLKELDAFIESKNIPTTQKDIQRFRRLERLKEETDE